jgi:hypothetical protein
MNREKLECKWRKSVKMFPRKKERRKKKDNLGVKDGRHIIDSLKKKAKSFWFSRSKNELEQIS